MGSPYKVCPRFRNKLLSQNPGISSVSYLVSLLLNTRTVKPVIGNFHFLVLPHHAWFVACGSTVNAIVTIIVLLVIVRMTTLPVTRTQNIITFPLYCSFFLLFSNSRFFAALCGYYCIYSIGGFVQPSVFG